MPKIVVLDGYALNPGDMSWEGLEGLGPVQVFDRTPESDVVRRAADAEIVLTCKTPLSAATLDRLPALKYIGVLATGFNIVDVSGAAARGVVVTNIPFYGTASVAQFTIALLLELCHHVGAHGQAVQAGEWSRNPDWSFWKSPQVELSGKTLGVIGFGRIGRQVARIAQALEMHVIASDANHSDPPDWPGFGWREVEALLAESDVVTLHCPLLPETRGLMDARRLAWMKPSAFLLNTSRGQLVVDTDLADALNAGRLAGAGLDVLSVEPPVEGSPLFTARNCLVTPHMAWATKEARRRLIEMVVENVGAFLQGSPRNVVS